MNDNPAPRRRRWLIWSTPLIVIVLLALSWFIYYEPTRERLAVEIPILENHSGEFMMADPLLLKKGIPFPPDRGPIRLRLHDDAMHHIILDPNLVSKEDIAEVKRLFPEAVVDVIPKAQWPKWP